MKKHFTEQRNPASRLRGSKLRDGRNGKDEPRQGVDGANHEPNEDEPRHSDGGANPNPTPRLREGKLRDGGNGKDEPRQGVDGANHGWITVDKIAKRAI